MNTLVKAAMGIGLGLMVAGGFVAVTKTIKKLRSDEGQSDDAESTPPTQDREVTPPDTTSTSDNDVEDRLDEADLSAGYPPTAGDDEDIDLNNYVPDPEMQTEYRDNNVRDINDGRPRANFGPETEVV